MIKRTAAILVFGIALIVGSTYASDLDKGFDAYKNGDYAEAVKWFRLGAEQGDVEAQNNLLPLHVCISPPLYLQLVKPASGI